MNNIEQIMSRPVITCRPRDTLNAAAGLMWENDCGALPVVDEQGKLVGMITDRDICMAIYTSGSSIHSVAVHDAMSKKVVSCLPTETLAEAESKMARAQVRRLPIVDGQGNPVGLVSLNDIARASLGGGKRAATDTISTLAAICEPRRRSVAQIKAA